MGLLSPNQSGHRACPKSFTALRGFSIGVSPLEPYHRSPEAAVKCYGAFVWTTDLDTQLKGRTQNQEILIRLVPEQNLLCGTNKICLSVGIFFLILLLKQRSLSDSKEHWEPLKNSTSFTPSLPLSIHTHTRLLTGIKRSHTVTPLSLMTPKTRFMDQAVWQTPIQILKVITLYVGKPLAFLWYYAISTISTQLKQLF